MHIHAQHTHTHTRLHNTRIQYMHIHVYMHTHTICTHTHIYVHTYLHTHLHTFIYIFGKANSFFKTESLMTMTNQKRGLVPWYQAFPLLNLHFSKPDSSSRSEMAGWSFVMSSNVSHLFWLQAVGAASCAAPALTKPQLWPEAVWGGSGIWVFVLSSLCFVREFSLTDGCFSLSYF